MAQHTRQPPPLAALVRVRGESARHGRISAGALRRISGGGGTRRDGTRGKEGTYINVNKLVCTLCGPGAGARRRRWGLPGHGGTRATKHDTASLLSQTCAKQTPGVVLKIAVVEGGVLRVRGVETSA